jgi:hypothetical protein
LTLNPNKLDKKELKDSQNKIDEDKKDQIKEQIKASYLDNKDPQKNKIIEFKKKLEMLKNNEAIGARSPKIEKKSKGKKIFFDEQLEEKDLHDLKKIKKFKLDDSYNINNSNISEFKFTTEKEINKIKDIHDFLKIAKRISKDDFNQSSHQINTNGNVSKI